MKRREFIAGLGSAVAWPAVGRAQRATKKIARIGWLASGDPISYRHSLAAFLDGLSALNYVEAKNILIEYRWANGVITRLQNWPTNWSVPTWMLSLLEGRVARLQRGTLRPKFPSSQRELGTWLKLGWYRISPDPAATSLASLRRFRRPLRNAYRC